jgi:hypothetical protein
MPEYPQLVPTHGAPDHYRPDAPPELVETAREFVARCRWVYARTFHDFAPHWYTLRRDAEHDGTVAGFDALRGLVLDHHFLRAWNGRSFRAVTIGGHLVWAMQTGGILLNGLPAHSDDWEQPPSLFDHL